MKYIWLLLFILLAACNRSPQMSDSEEQIAVNMSPTHTATLLPTSTTIPTHTATPLSTHTPTVTPTPANTATSTPLPPTSTSTPRPVTHANIGWEGIDTEPRSPFPDETHIKNEILEYQKNNQVLNAITEEDIKIVWYTANDGTIFWRPYFTLNLSVANDDLFLYVYPLTTDSNGNLSLITIPKILDVSAMERLGYINDITDIRLVWNDKQNKPVLAVERNGKHFWYPDELNDILISYDQELTPFGLPEKPKPATEFVAVMHVHHVHDVYLFEYDETTITTAGISNPNEGPLYKLEGNQWEMVTHSRFLGDGSPLLAYVGYTSINDGGLYIDGSLYIEKLTNYQTGIDISSNAHTPLAPVAVRHDEPLDYYFLLASPVWSPNGQYIAFIAKEDDILSLAVYDIHAQTWQSLTEIPQNAIPFGDLIWSPDGKWLTYSYGHPVTIKSVSFPDGQDYYIGQGCNPQWFDDNDELIIIFNPNCYINYIETSNPDGSDTDIEPIVHRSAVGENIVRYVPSKEAFLIYRSKESGADTLFYKPVNGDDEILLGELPLTEDRLYWDTYSKLLFSPDMKWLFVPLEQAGNGQDIGYVQNLETKEEYLYEDLLGAYLSRNVTSWTPDSKGLVLNGGTSIYDATTGELVYHYNYSNFNLGRTPQGWNNNDGMLYWPTK